MTDARARKLRHILERSQRATDAVGAIVRETDGQLKELHAIMVRPDARSRGGPHEQPNVQRPPPLCTS